MALSKQLQQFLAQDKLVQHKKIVLALSGGLDSMVLLHLLAMSSIPNSLISTVHVHHGLSELADDWVDFCRERCADYGIAFIVQYVSLTQDLGLGIEGAARKMRYLALSNYIDNQSVLLTAQHQDDQVETLLLALKRGSGTLGLGAMPSIMIFAQCKLARPLLTTSRHDIEQYATKHRLNWVEDDSNSDSRFDRNFLRHHVIKFLNERWPSFSRSAARSATLCQESNELLDEVASDDLCKVQVTALQLSIKRLLTMSTVRCNNVLRYWLRQCDVILPSSAVLRQIRLQILQGKDDSDPLIKLSDLSLRRYRDGLYLVQPTDDISQIVVPWQGQVSLALPDGLGQLIFNRQSDKNLHLIKPASDVKVTITFSIAGSYKAWPSERSKRRTVKKLLQEYQVPTWQRQRIPFIFYDDVLVAALGLWVEKDFVSSMVDDMRVCWQSPSHQIKREKRD